MSSKSVIVDGYECDGSWFLPEASDKKIIGHLELIPGETGKLTLMGTFAGFSKQEIPSFICGIATTGTYITLHKCIKTNETLSGAGEAVTTFSAEVILIGAHFFREEDLDFEEVYFKYHNFDEWLNVSGFDISRPNTPGRAEVKYQQPDTIPLYSSDAYDVRIFFGYRGPNYDSVQKHVMIEQSASVVVTMKASRSLKSYLRIHKHMVNFLHLATRDSVYITDISATVSATIGDGESATERKIPVTIFVAVGALPPEKAVSPHEMAFLYEDIAERRMEVMSAWFQKSELLHHACSVLFGSLYGRKLYLENRVIGVIQAAEAIHRLIFGGSYERSDRYQDSLYQRLIQAIPEYLDRDYRESLKSRLRFANEYSLRRRIRELARACPKEIILEMIGSGKAVEQFINKLVNLRNSLTHHSSDGEGLSGIKSRAHWMIQTTKIILEIVLLKQIGFSGDDIRELVDRNYIYKQEISMARRNINGLGHDGDEEES